jgi:hypothetical protein
MGWTVYYQVHRDKVLSDAERARLGAIIGEVNGNDLTSEPFRLQYATAPRADRAITWGASKLSSDDTEMTDLGYILDGLTDIRELLDGATFHVSDDHEVVLWDKEGERYSVDAGEADAEAPVTVVHEDNAPWIEAIAPD